MFIRKMLMAPEGDQGAGAATPPAPAAPAATPAAAPAVEATPEPQAPITTKGGKTIPLSQNTIDRLKREHAEKGKRAAAREFDEKAKALGYASVDDMLRAVELDKKKRAEKKPAPNGQQRQAAAQNGQPKNTAAPNGQQRRDEREQRAMSERYENERKERIRAQNRARRAEQERLAIEGSKELEIEALKAGITDPEYAVSLFTRECQNKQASLAPDQYEKWISEIDERKYFESLKQSRPHLFAEVIKPVTTGTTPTDAPPPGAAQVTQRIVDSTKKDVRGMSRQQWQEEVQRRGLRVPTT